VLEPERRQQYREAKNAQHRQYGEAFEDTTDSARCKHRDYYKKVLFIVKLIWFLVKPAVRSECDNHGNHQP
jgi:hypothetical protein